LYRSEKGLNDLVGVVFVNAAVVRSEIGAQKPVKVATTDRTELIDIVEVE
jgi:hypothetical protein